MKRVRISAAAERDIQQVFSYYETKRDGLGEQFLDRVDETTSAISRAPEGSRLIVDDVRRAPILRQFGDYALWYRNRQADVLVVGCLSGRRAPSVARKRAKHEL